MKRSKCCNAKIVDKLSIEYPNKTKDELIGKTNYYICSKCNKPIIN